MPTLWTSSRRSTNSYHKIARGLEQQLGTRLPKNGFRMSDTITMRGIQLSEDGKSGMSGRIQGREVAARWNRRFACIVCYVSEMALAPMLSASSSNLLRLNWATGLRCISGSLKGYLANRYPTLRVLKARLEPVRDSMAGEKRVHIQQVFTRGQLLNAIRERYLGVGD